MESGHRGGLVCVLLASFHMVFPIQVGAADLTSAQLADAQAKLDQAKQLTDSGQQADAVAIYQKVAELYPNTPQAQEALVSGGLVLGALGKKTEAIAQYNAAITNHSKSYFTEIALSSKAALCKDLGQISEATQAAERLRLEFPESELAIQAAGIKGAIAGLSPQEIDALMAKEREAAEALKDIRNAMDNKGAEGCLRALASLDDLQRSSPDTAAALASYEVKGDALVRLNRCSEAIDAYTVVMNKVAPVAPDSLLLARVRRRQGQAHVLSAELGLRKLIAHAPNIDRKRVAQEAREHCQKSLEVVLDPPSRADMRVLLVALDLVEKKYESALSFAEAYLKINANETKLKRYPKQILTIQLLAAEAARRSWQLDKALKMNQEAKRLIGLLDSKQREMPWSSEVLPQAYYQTLMTLQQLHARPEEIQKEKDEIRTLFPMSAHAAFIKNK